MNLANKNLKSAGTTSWPRFPVSFLGVFECASRIPVSENQTFNRQPFRWNWAQGTNAVVRKGLRHLLEGRIISKLCGIGGLIQTKIMSTCAMST